MPATAPIAPRIAAGLTGSLLTLGCGGGETPQPDRDPAAAPPATAPAGAERVGADTIDVVLEEYLIAMPGAVASGPLTLRISNRGVEEHNLQLRNAADSLVWRTEGNLSPGETLVERLDLEPGTYAALCDFAGHDARGMRTAVSVRPGGS